MSVSQVAPGNIKNRSPWVVRVRRKPDLDKQFSYPRDADAQAYCAELCAQGLKAKVLQLENSFQLRVRRKGVPLQFITFGCTVA